MMFLLLMMVFQEYSVFMEGGAENNSHAVNRGSLNRRIGPIDWIPNVQYHNAYGSMSREAQVGDAPFVVAIVGQDKYDGAVRAWCTGTIITEQWTLTAAHCSRLFVDREGFKVFAGCSSPRDFDITISISSRQIRRPVDGLMHPKYQYWPSPGFVYDVGLIKVHPVFVFGPSVNKIRMWADKWSDALDWNSTLDSYQSFQCTAYGWGVLEVGKRRGPLRMVNISVRHGPGGCTCLSREMDRLQICTAPQTNALCPDDSGGPLVCNGLLAGISRGGNTCPFKYAYEKANHLEDDLKRGLSDPKSCGVPNFINQWTSVRPIVAWVKHHELPNLMSSTPGFSYSSSCIIQVMSAFNSLYSI